jgi:muconolactone delta-isomerase
VGGLHDLLGDLHEHDRPDTDPGRRRGRISELTGQGSLERLWLKADRSGAVLLLNADNEQHAQRLIDSLPLVQAGVAKFDLTALVEPPG